MAYILEWDTVGGHRVQIEFEREEALYLQHPERFLPSISSQVPLGTLFKILAQDDMLRAPHLRETGLVRICGEADRALTLQEQPLSEDECGNLQRVIETRLASLKEKMKSRVTVQEIEDAAAIARDTQHAEAMKMLLDRFEFDFLGTAAFSSAMENASATPERNMFLHAARYLALHPAIVKESEGIACQARETIRSLACSPGGYPRLLEEVLEQTGPCLYAENYSLSELLVATFHHGTPENFQVMWNYCSRTNRLETILDNVWMANPPVGQYEMKEHYKRSTYSQKFDMLDKWLDKMDAEQAAYWQRKISSAGIMECVKREQELAPTQTEALRRG